MGHGRDRRQRSGTGRGRTVIGFLGALPRKIVEDVRASYWFLPAAMSLGALGAAALTETLDRRGDLPAIPEIFYAAQPGAARAVLGVIAQAMLGATGVLFSMTIVAVSFASTNFGPRLLRNFMQDRGVQISLGVLLSTFVYALTVLRGIRGTEDGSFVYVPALGMTVALALVALCVGVLIYFVHHIPELISLENVTAALGRRLLAAIERLPPGTAPPEWSEDEARPRQPVCLAASGYLQAIDTRKLDRLERRGQGWELYRVLWPGDFVAPHRPVAYVLSRHPVPEAVLAKLRDCYAVGNGRTEAQNPVFIVEQLTEIVARALSPGINDPFTAITCLDWLHAALHRLADKGPVETEAYGAAAPIFGFLSVLDTAHRCTRAYVASDPTVALHAFRLLQTLLDRLPQGPRRTAVVAELMALRHEAQARSGAAPEIAALPVVEPT